MATPLRDIPTTIITGFLGVGKTTAITELLRLKPARESWAVLINEFGEVGVDGALLQGQQGDDSGIHIREVPGGCMCCAAGLPMQVGLNHLLIRARPDRLLIEPTGLGHPKEVLQVLSDLYRDVLDVQQVLTLVDARQLADQRYTDNDTFNQQIAIADCIIGNKSDLYQPEDSQRLRDYVQHHGRTHASVLLTTRGQLALSMLDRKADAPPELDDEQSAHPHHHLAQDETPILAIDTPLPASGYLKAENSGEGHRSVGWRFSSDRLFHHDRLFSFLSGIDAMRLKAVFLTDKGAFGYNLTNDALSEITLQTCDESRIEIINKIIDPNWETQLMQCLIA